jgi:predicted nucleic acid-binding protein
VILVDTSVWIDHLRSSEPALVQRLWQAQVLMHPMVLIELACGNLADRDKLLALWRNLPQLPPVSDDEALYFLHAQNLMGRGIGYVDLHLLAATAVRPGTRLWSRDRRLSAAAEPLGLAVPETGGGG